MTLVLFYIRINRNWKSNQQNGINVSPSCMQLFHVVLEIFLNLATLKNINKILGCTKFTEIELQPRTND